MDERATHGIKPEINTPDWLRSFKGCEHYTDAEANEVIVSLDMLACVFLKASDKNIQYIDNQMIVSLKPHDAQQKIAA